MLDTLFYGNTILRWLIALSGIVGSFVLGRLIYWIFSRWIKIFTRRTRTELDDSIVDKLKEPFSFGLTLLGVLLSLNTLAMTDSAAELINRIFALVAVLLGAWAIVRLYDSFHTRYAMRFAAKTSTDLDNQLLPVVRTGVSFVIWSLAAVIGLNNAGYDVGAVLAGLGIGGLAFALAAQHTFGDFVGGLSIFLDRHINLGGRIQLHGASGDLIDGVVEDISLRRIKVRTRYEGRIVLVPNSMVANQDVVNVDSERSRQIFATYKLAPETSYEKIQLALKLLKDIAKGNENTDDLVVTGFIQVTEVSKDIMLLYWIKPEFSNIKTRTEINLEIVQRFEQNRIEFTDRIKYEYQKEVSI